MKAIFPSLFLCYCLGLVAQTTGFPERDPHYRLQPEDKIEVQYRYTPEYNALASVQPDGYASMPLIGQVKLAGLTMEEAAAAIRQKAGQRLNEPEVIVLLKEYVKPFFTVAGEVSKPGRIELHGQVTLVEAIALSGGFKDSAHRTQVLLLRKSAPDMAEVRIYDLRKMMSASGIREDITLKSGDMLVIPRNVLSKIEPFIRISEAGLYGLASKFL
jgi:polysaccharide export outer membrane protein